MGVGEYGRPKGPREWEEAQNLAGDGRRGAQRVGGAAGHGAPADSPSLAGVEKELNLVREALAVEVQRVERLAVLLFGPASPIPESSPEPAETLPAILGALAGDLRGLTLALRCHLDHLELGVMGRRSHD